MRLTDADFDAYQPAKQRSNVYNRERMETKQRLLPLARTLAAQVTGSDGAPLDVSASVEHPALVNHKVVDAQHVYFSRGEVARRSLETIIDRARGVASLLDDPTPQRSHVHIVLSVLHDRLEVALRLHPEATVDRQNLVRKAQDTFELDRLVASLRKLPDAYRAGIAPELGPASTLDRDAVSELIKQLATLPTGSPSFFVVMRSWSRAAVLAVDDIETMLAAELSSLSPIYRFCAWSRDNDFVSVREALEKKQTERRQKGIVRGDEIRVVRGLFSGQQGTVQEVDPRGAMRVLVGKRTLKLDAADVERR